MGIRQQYLDCEGEDSNTPASPTTPNSTNNPNCPDNHDNLNNPINPNQTQMRGLECEMGVPQHYPDYEDDNPNDPHHALPRRIPLNSSVKARKQTRTHAEYGLM